MSQMVHLERTSSIENEPRTLKLDQIHLAREAALYVVNTRSIEEALRIFTEGLEPVVNCARDDKATVMDYSGDLKCSSPSHLKHRGLGDIASHLKHRGLGDIASAPF